ncbi:hypothetical protein ABZ714_34400 [Streptomyces sp. NPDC006798]
MTTGPYPACYDDPDLTCEYDETDGYCPCEEPDLTGVRRIDDVPVGNYL